MSVESASVSHEPYWWDAAPRERLGPGDPARMAARIIESVAVEPAKQLDSTA